MNNRPRAAAILIASFLAFGAVSQARAAAALTQGFLTVDRWENIGGNTGTQGIADLVTAIAGGAPTATFYAPGADVEQTNPDIDNYGQRLWGWLKPDVTGDYDFFTYSDDPSQVFLNATAASSGTNSLPNVSTDTPICEEDSCCNAFAEPSAGTTRTTAAPIHLEAGKLYGFVVLHKEGGGGDYVRVAWRLTTDTTAAASLKTIPGANCWTPVDPAGKTATITQQPQSVSTFENRTATFSVAVATGGAGGDVNHPGVPLYAVAWTTNGVVVPNVAGPTYTTGVLSTNDTGLKVQAMINTLIGPITSTNATLTVKVDTNPPQVLSVGSINSFNDKSTQVTVVYDKPLQDAATATALANYSLAPAAPITAATYFTNSSGVNTSPKQSGVTLTATGLVPGTSYSLKISNIVDYKGNKMPTTTVTFVASTQNWISIGDPAGYTPAVFETANNGFNLLAGGNAFWGTEDDITMVYDTVKGDFDKIAQVEYVDPASNWARAGIDARESLNNGAPTTDSTGTNPASRHQMIISDPSVKFDGTAGNNQYEFNRRTSTGGATTADGGLSSPTYPNSWVRLKRTGQVFNMFYGTNGVNWVPGRRTDMADATLNANSEPPIGDTMYVGPTYGPENGNISNDPTAAAYAQRGEWVTRIRNYGDLHQKPRGLATYGIGLNFGADEVGGALSPGDIAGVDTVAQGNWNNILGSATSTDTGPVTSVVADNNGTPETASVTVDWNSAGTWASSGPRGEENNSAQLPATDLALMTGYLDSGAATTTQVKISGLPSKLTSTGYDVYVYCIGGVSGRGGGYRITDANGAALKDYVKVQGPASPTGWIKAVPQGTNYAAANYVVFTNLTAASIVVEATTDNGLAFGGTPRSPINAIQFVPTGGGSVTTLTNGLVAYWNFDGNLLEAVDQLDGTGRGAKPVEFVSGKDGFGQSLKLIGTNYVEITGGSATNLDFANGSLSIAGWFKVEAFDKQWQALLSKGENSNYRIARRSDTTTNNTIAYAGGVGEGPGDTPQVADGQWHHFVAITDAKGVSFGTALYIDGTMYSVNTNKATLTANPSKRLFIGENPDSVNRQWNGEIDDLAIWNRVLTPTEVELLYNRGTGTPLGAFPGVPEPTPPSNLNISSITASGGNVTITWTGGGTLQSAAAVTGTWADLTGKTSPASIPIAGTASFFRIRQ